jgi:GT2 family glycosyltransferase
MIDATVAVVIVTYNSSVVLPGLLDSLHDGLFGIARRDIVVVDNASTDASIAVAHAHPIKPRVIEGVRNAGYAAGINAGAATIADDAYLLVLNPDIRLNPGAAMWMLEALAGPEEGIVVPKILAEDGTVYSSLRREPSVKTIWSEAILGGERATRMDLSEALKQPGRFDWATGAILMISPSCRRRVGAWDESFFLYCEEVDYFWRARRAGFDFVYERRATCVHLSGDYRVRPHLSAIMAANRVRYHRRHHGAVSTALFRTGLAVGEAIRVLKNRDKPESPAHRAALRAALTVRATRGSTVMP